MQIANRCQISDEAFFQGLNIAENALKSLWEGEKCIDAKNQSTQTKLFLMEHPPYIFAVALYVASKLLDLTYTDPRAYLKLC